MSFIINLRKILISAISIQIIFILSFLLSKCVDAFLVIRMLSSFVYLTFVPGLLIVYLLGLEVRSTPELIIYSVGLSLWFIMFLGFIINVTYPIIGITKPLSENSLFTTFIFVTLILWLLCWKVKRNISIKITSSLFELKKASLLIFLPFLSVFGAYYLNYYDSNIISLILLLIISFIPVIMLVMKFDHSVYPFILLLVSVSLLLQNSLVPLYIRYGDAEIEYYISNLVKTNGFWDPSLPRNKNAMLAIVMIHPIYSILCNIGLVWVYKIIYPIIFSFIVVVLYELFKSQTKNSDIAFISTYFFMSSYMFFTWLSKSTRQGLAELFLALLILTIVHPSISRLNKAILMVVFSFSLVTSHYGTSYIFMLVLVASIVILLITGYYNVKSENITPIISVSFCIYYIILTLGWYIYASSSSTFNSLITFGESVLSTISTEFISPRTSFTIYVIEEKWTPSLQFLRSMYLLIVIITGLGLLSHLIEMKRNDTKIKFNKFFTIFANIFFLIILFTILPIVSKKITSDRIFIIAQIFLAPFFVLGVFSICNYIKFQQNYNLKINIRDIKYIFVLIIVLVFFFFNSGLSSELLFKNGDYTPNILISKARAINGDIDTRGLIVFYKQYISEYDVASSSWLVDNADIHNRLYSSNWIGAPGLPYGYPIIPLGVLLPEYVGVKLPKYEILKENTTVVSNSYIYLGFPNIVNNIMVSKIQTPPDWYETEKLHHLLSNCSKIYTNGYGMIYYK